MVEQLRRPTDQVEVYCRMSYEEQQELTIVIVGNPETVTQKLTTVITELNPGYLHIYGNEGGMPPKDGMRSIELMRKEVLPALHEIKLQPYERARYLRKGVAQEPPARPGWLGVAPPESRHCARVV